MTIARKPSNAGLWKWVLWGLWLTTLAGEDVLAARRETVCVERNTSVQPPPFDAVPTLVAENFHPNEQALLPPVCPEGHVPELPDATLFSPRHRASNTTGIQKGNPLLPAVQAAPSFNRRPSPMQFASFYSVYGPDNPGLGDIGAHFSGQRQGRRGCGGIRQYGSCYYYASAGEATTADGGGMSVSVEQPKFAGQRPGHSLVEIALSDEQEQANIVEIGWTVSPAEYGNKFPHLFVFHWIDGLPTCYNACGWRQWSNTYYPGQNLHRLVGQLVYIGYVYWNGNWWAWFDNQWLGYFPGSEWQGRFEKTAILQWFGEIASGNGLPPRIQMGRGAFPQKANSAVMGALCPVDANAWTCRSGNRFLSLYATKPRYYKIMQRSLEEVRYGGPGR